MDYPYIQIKEPMLAPNKLLDVDIPIESISYPRLCSIKYNGIRAMTYKDVFLSRAGKAHMICPDLMKQLEHILRHANKNGVILEGEFHSNSHNTVGETRSILAGTIPTPDDFAFKVFYEIPIEVWNSHFLIKMKDIIPSSYDLPRLEAVKQWQIDSAQEFRQTIESYRHRNVEGFMLIDINAHYKHGRVTEAQGGFLKYKYYAGEEDAKIVGITARKQRRAGVTGLKNLYGKQEAVYTQDSFEDTDIAGCLIVESFNYSNKGEKLNIPFPIGWTIEMRRQAYKQFGTGLPHDIKGEWVSFRRLNCEDRDKPIAIKCCSLETVKTKEQLCVVLRKY